MPWALRSIPRPQRRTPHTGANCPIIQNGRVFHPYARDDRGSSTRSGMKIIELVDALTLKIFKFFLATGIFF